MESRPGESEDTCARDEAGPKGRRPEPEFARMLYQVVQMPFIWHLLQAQLNSVDQTRGSPG